MSGSSSIIAKTRSITALNSLRGVEGGAHAASCRSSSRRRRTSARPGGGGAARARRGSRPAASPPSSARGRLRRARRGLAACAASAWPRSSCARGLGRRGAARGLAAAARFAAATAPPAAAAGLRPRAAGVPGCGRRRTHLERGDARRQALDVGAEALDLVEHAGLEHLADPVGGVGELAAELGAGPRSDWALLGGRRERALDAATASTASTAPAAALSCLPLFFLSFLSFFAMAARS